MNVLLRESAVNDDWHDGDMVLAGRFEYERIGATGDKAIRINGIPRGNEDVDFVGMSQERAYGLVLTRQVEKGLGLIGEYGEAKKDDGSQDEESAFHRPRSLPAFAREVQRANPIPTLSTFTT